MQYRSKSSRSVRLDRCLGVVLNEWDREGQCRSAIGLRENVETSSQCLCAFAHTREPVPITFCSNIKPTTVIAQLQKQPAAIHTKLDLSGRACRMSHDVVDRFFEYQEELPSKVGADVCVVVVIRGAKQE